MKSLILIASMVIGTSAFATKPAASAGHSEHAAPAAAHSEQGEHAAAKKMNEMEAKKACKMEKAADMTKCMSEKTGAATTK